MARARKTTAAASLRIRDFLAIVHASLTEEMGREMREFESRQRFGYLQYYRGEPGVHYEIWVQRKTQRLEIGLHFETADRDRNYAAAEALAERAPEIVARVGPEYELEEWTKTWTRLHRSFAAPVLTEELASQAASDAAALIRGMEPLLDDLALR
jgi:hypothetical protein